MKKGRLILNSATIESHEMESLNKLVRDGNVVELLKPSLTKHVKTGDFIMECVIWEMKCPIGKSPRTMEHIFRKAAHQAENLVIDLCRVRVPEMRAIKSLQKLFEKR